MEKKATELGMPATLYYMFPKNNFLSAADLGKAAQLHPRIDGHMLADIHIGGGGAVESARSLFASNTSFKMAAVNAETNAGTHVFSRAMSEARRHRHPSGPLLASTSLWTVASAMPPRTTPHPPCGVPVSVLVPSVSDSDWCNPMASTSVCFQRHAPPYATRCWAAMLVGC